MIKNWLIVYFQSINFDTMLAHNICVEIYCPSFMFETSLFNSWAKLFKLQSLNVSHFRYVVFCHYLMIVGCKLDHVDKMHAIFIFGGLRRSNAKQGKRLNIKMQSFQYMNPSLHIYAHISGFAYSLVSCYSPESTMAGSQTLHEASY